MNCIEESSEAVLKIAIIFWTHWIEALEHLKPEQLMTYLSPLLTQIKHVVSKTLTYQPNVHCQHFFWVFTPPFPLIYIITLSKANESPVSLAHLGSFQNRCLWNTLNSNKRLAHCEWHTPDTPHVTNTKKLKNHPVMEPVPTSPLMREGHEFEKDWFKPRACFSLNIKKLKAIIWEP